MTPSILITVALFGSLGYFCSRFLRPRWQLVLILLLAVVVGGWIGVNTSILSWFGVDLRLNWAIRACCIGLLAGVLVRRRPAFAG